MCFVFIQMYIFRLSIHFSGEFIIKNFTIVTISFSFSVDSGHAMYRIKSLPDFINISSLMQTVG